MFVSCWHYDKRFTLSQPFVGTVLRALNNLQATSANYTLPFDAFCSYSCVVLKTFLISWTSKHLRHSKATTCKEGLHKTWRQKTCLRTRKCVAGKLWRCLIWFAYTNQRFSNTRVYEPDIQIQPANAGVGSESPTPLKTLAMDTGHATFFYLICGDPLWTLSKRLTPKINAANARAAFRSSPFFVHVIFLLWSTLTGLSTWFVAVLLPLCKSIHLFILNRWIHVPSHVPTYMTSYLSSIYPFV